MNNKKRFVVKYGDGKDYEIDCKDREDAGKILAEAIEYMNGENWCDLHVEEIEEEEHQ